MKNVAASLFTVSSNFPPVRRGGRRAAAASQAEKSAKASLPVETEILANDEAGLSAPAETPQANKPKRHDAKATPPTVTAQKAKEMAGREAGLQQGEVDPVVDLVSGSGDPKTGLAPLDLDSLAGGDSIISHIVIPRSAAVTAIPVISSAVVPLYSGRHS